MIARIARLFANAPSDAETPRSDDAAVLGAQERMLALNVDPYLQVADAQLGLISIFDDLKYDRSDADMLSPAMRRYAAQKLAPLGFRQTSGNMLESAAADLRVLIPKSHALGASPFDITRYSPKRAQDYYLLTPTQIACQFIDAYATEDAVERIKALVVKHPINLLKLADHLEDKPRHQGFRAAIGHLKLVQREAVESEPLCRRRALK